jgi:hypothetical protein
LTALFSLRVFAVVAASRALLALNLLNQWWTFGIMGGAFVGGVGAVTVVALWFL